MSTTVMVTKNGQQVPIKLSIWDAFKGVPIPKPRLYRCSCCNAVHRSTTNKKLEASKSKNDAVKVEADSDGWTAQEDAKIKEMKTKNPIAQWKAVAEALGSGKSAEECKDRYKVLMDREKEGMKEKTQTESKKEGDKAPENKNNGEKANAKGEEGQKLTKAQKKAQKHAAAKKEGDDKKEEGVEKKANAIAEKIQREKEAKPTTVSIDDKQKWIAAASKHFDKTGIRITPEQARKIAAEA